MRCNANFETECEYVRNSECSLTESERADCCPKKEPLVSVVIITYRRPDRLPEAIRTASSQTHKSLEILVVDGANSDENKIVVENHSKEDPRVRYLPVEPEAVSLYSQFGMQHSRNVGCRAARGEYIAMLDDDDTWDPRKTELQLKVFEKQKNVALVTSYNKILSGGKVVIDKPVIEPTYEVLLKSFNLASTSTYLIKKSVLEEIGYWNETLHGMHEYDLALKFTKLGYRVITVPKVLMTRTRLSNLDAKYYTIKIKEVLDLWKNYSHDFIRRLGLTGFFFNSFKTLFLFFIFLLGFIIKEKEWAIIYPLKTLYEQKKLISEVT